MKKQNEGFVCQSCGKDILPAEKTSRNHCPRCFLSIHVDNSLPGDRASNCKGEMVPVEYLIANGETKIHFVCLTCGKDHRNKLAHDDQWSELDKRIDHRKLKRETLSRSA